MSQRRARTERHTNPNPKPPPRRGWGKAAAFVGVLLALSAVVAAVALSRNTSHASAPVSRSQSSSSLALNGTDPVTGKTVSLASYAGKPVVLNMWASWCTGCAAEARALASFEHAHPEAQVIGLDVQDSKDGAKAFYRRFGWKHPSIYDPDGVIAARLGLQGLPTTLFLDRTHHVVGRILGDTNLAGFSSGLRAAAKT